MTSSDHRHPGAKKQKFPLIVGPPFIHATNNFDCSTRGRDLLATRQPEAQPIVRRTAARVFFTHAELDSHFELGERGGFVAAERFCHSRIRHAPKYAGAKVLQPGNHLPVAGGIQCDNGPHSPRRATQEQPAKILHGLKVQACHRFQVIHQQEHTLMCILVGMRPGSQ